LLTVGIYLFFHYQLSSAEAHPRNRPEYLVASRDGWRVFVRLCNWTTAVYEACLGTLLERTGSLRLETYTDVASLGFGALLAILIQLLVGRRNDESQPEGAESFQRRLVVGLIMGVGLGMLPIVVMGFRPDVNPFESRFWAPVAPYAVCASVALVAQLFSNQKQWLLPPLCAILAAWALVSDGIPAAKELQRVSAWGPQLQKYVDADVNEDAMCVAIFENGWPHGALLPNDYELTPRLARDWPPAQRARFWAFASYDKMMEREFTSGIDPDHSLHSPRLDREYMYRVGPIHRVLWVYVSSDGDLQVTKVDTVEEQAL
jgi:hypothetical protein